jgi:hypothetical protein
LHKNGKLYSDYPNDLILWCQSSLTGLPMTVGIITILKPFLIYLG